MEIKYNTAKLAKEKGFKVNDLSVKVFIDTEEGEFLTGTPVTMAYSEPQWIQAPLQFELQKWLRDGKTLDWSILVYVVPFFSENPRQEQAFVWRRGVLHTLDPVNTYEDALELGLNFGLNLIQEYEFETIN